MKLRTIIPVEYGTGTNTKNTGILEGSLRSAGWIDESFNTVGANYVYRDTTGNVVYRNGVTFSGQDLEDLFNAISQNIPEGLSYRETEQYKYYLAFAYEMARTYEVEISDIEIVL